MSDRDDAKTPTLIPYLDSHARGIAISFGDDDDAPAGDGEPGTVNGPYTTLRWGRAMVDGAGSIADLTFLFQSDRYAAAASELIPVTNADIDRRWQTILGHHGGAASAVGSNPLSSQADQEGVFQPYGPLFHCRHIHAFFPPLCPQCGAALTLCRDDDLLEKAGLPTYGRTLQRFLHCAPCFAADGAGTYYTHSPMANPPDNVNHCDNLIEAFSRLLAKTDLAHALPCIECQQAVMCYGPEALVLNRMTAFQFYPFYLLVQPAPDINAVDFVALLSGADPEIISRQAGQQQVRHRWSRFTALQPKLHQGAGFLFEGHRDRFLETLYLKLSFLHEFHALLAGSRYQSASAIYLEGLWVKLGDEGARLPWLWNFSIEEMDPFGQSPGVANGGSEASDIMSRAWFYVLLSNPRQPMESIWPQIEAIAANIQDGDPLKFELPDPLVGSQNIFWTEQHPDLTPEGQGLWQDALNLGLRLLQPQSKVELGKDNAFAEALSKLKSDVRENLFRKSPDSPSRQPDTARPADDRQIGEILVSISKQWADAGAAEPAEEQGAEPDAPARPAALPNEDGDYEETVILMPDDNAAARPEDTGPEETLASDLEKTMVLDPPPQSTDDIDQTVVLRPEREPVTTDDQAATVALGSGARQGPHRGMGKTIGIPSTIETAPGDDLEKTVVISAPGKPAPPPTRPVAPPPADRVEDDLEKTVVISAPGKQAPGSPPNGTTASSPAPMADDDLEKTVVIHGGPSPVSDAGSLPVGGGQTPVPEDSKSPVDEVLEETVVIQTRKHKDKKP